jgi:hypothetical protein
MDYVAQYQRYVEGFVSFNRLSGVTWSDDRTTIRIPKRQLSGYDIEVAYYPVDHMVHIGTDRGYHDHVHVETADELKDCLSSIFGLVRDMLSSNMRILETLSGGKGRKWELQSLRSGNWVTESSTGLLLWNYFGQKTHREYSNETLPPRTDDV